MIILKKAIYAKLYSASEITLGLLTGSYPPPHKEMDKYMKYLEQMSALSQIDKLRDAGFVIIVWCPEEIDDLEFIEGLEEACIEAGSNYIDDNRIT